MYGALIRAGVLTPTRDLEERIRGKLGLEPLPEEAQKLWSESGGVRKPLTIKDPAEQPPDGTGNMELSDKPDRTDLSDALEEWFGPEADAIAKTEELSDEELDRELRAGLPSIARSIRESTSEAFEKLAAADMKRSYERGYQNKNR